MSPDTVASMASWTCVAAFALGAAVESYTLLAAAMVLATTAIGIDCLLIRRKVAARP